MLFAVTCCLLFCSSFSSYTCVVRQVHHLGGSDDADPGGAEGQHSRADDLGSRREDDSEGFGRKGERRESPTRMIFLVSLRQSG